MIPLTQGKFTIVDEADAEAILNSGKWQAQRTPRSFYAKRSEGGVTIPMHAQIVGSKWADHVNRNGLDNRRINLRPATAGQNLANKALTSRNKSGYKGVSWSREARKWRAQVTVDGWVTHLGWFPDPVEAARAYNQAAVEAFGEFAWLNPLPPSRQASQPSAPVQLAGPVGRDLITLIAQAVMEFPRARHQDGYLAWRAGVKMRQMRPVLRHLAEKGWFEVERKPGRTVRCHYTATEAGRDGFAALLTT
jgi:hypothetical protein